MPPKLSNVTSTGAGVYYYVGNAYQIVDLVKMGAIPRNKEEYRHIRRYAQLNLPDYRLAPFEFYANKELRSRINDAIN